MIINKARPLIELMRWHKPTGTILALTPALWSVGLATPPTTLLMDPKIFAVFSAGAIVARGMGCTLNDLLDRKYDRLVDRTKDRPLASGALTVKEGLTSLAVQSSLGLYILSINNIEVIKLGLFSGVMISTYPLFKRFTNWPQAMLAITMNWGVLMGYAAVNGHIGLSDISTVLPIYLGSIFWTFYYDTIYAHQDKTDDLFIGVKSSALALGLHTKKFLYQMSAAMTISLSTAGLMTSQMWPYYVTVIASGAYQANQVRRINLDRPDHCWTAFDKQKYIGILILMGVMTSNTMKYKKSNREISNIENINKSIDD